MILPNVHQVWSPVRAEPATVTMSFVELLVGNRYEMVVHLSTGYACKTEIR